MKKINFLFFILLLLFPESYLNLKPFTNLYEYIREHVTNMAIIFLPQRHKTDLLQLCFHLSKIEKSYELNKMETAYIIFTWIHRNIKLEISNNLKYNKTPDIIFKTGKGRSNEISVLFKEMCNQLEIEAGIISGYVKFTKKIENDREWNYIKFNNTFYLVDASYIDLFKYTEEASLFYYDLDVYFGTKPEIFIRSHFPNEAKWQLLNETNSISFKQFLSMAYLNEGFYIDGFKTISPDSFFISNKSFNFNLTYDANFNYRNFYAQFIDFSGKEEDFINCKFYLSSDGKLNIIINSIPEYTDYIIIHAVGYNIPYEYSVSTNIVSFKIINKNDDNNLSKQNNNFNNKTNLK